MPLYGELPRLPPESWKSIFDVLSLGEFSKIRLVCKNWNLWTRKDVSRRILTVLRSDSQKKLHLAIAFNFDACLTPNHHSFEELYGRIWASGFFRRSGTAKKAEFDQAYGYYKFLLETLNADQKRLFSDVCLLLRHHADAFQS